MTGVLLDTNVVSELVRTVPEPAVTNYVSSVTDGWLSVITLHELRFGIARLDRGHRRTGLETAVDRMLELFSDRIIPLGSREADVAATLRADVMAKGRAIQLGDALIAATAISHGLMIATQNLRDFELAGVRLANPWEYREA